MHLKTAILFLLFNCALCMADSTDLKIVRLSEEKEAWLSRDLKKAIELLQPQADAAKATVVSLHNLGYLYYLKGQNGLALKYLQKAIEKDDSYPYPYLITAHIYEKSGNLLGALSQIRRGLALKSDDYDLLLESGKIYKDMGKTEQAEKILLELVNNYEDRATPRIYLAELFRRLGQYGKALAILGTEDKIYPESDLLIEKSRIQKAMGRSDLSRDILIRLYQEYPYDQEIQAYLDTLRLVHGVENVNPKTFLKKYSYKIKSGESLDYTVRYGFITLGWLKIRMLPGEIRNGKTVYPIHFFVDTNPSFDFLLSLHHIYESYIDAETMNAVQTRLYTPGDDDYLARIYYFEYEQSMFQAYNVYADGRYERRQKLLPQMAQDGTSMLYFARGLVSSEMDGSTTVVIDEEFKYGHIAYLNEREEVDTGDQEINAIKIFARAEFEGIAGMNGDAWGWFTPDDRVVPVKGEIKIIIGSISVEIDEGQLD